MNLNRVAAILTIVALLLTGLNTYIFATLEQKLTAKFDERYMERREVELLIKERDVWRAIIDARLERIESKLDVNSEDLKDILRRQSAH